MIDTIEKHTRYSTVVDDLPEAWKFVMGKIDSLGPDPAIEILPSWSWDTGSDSPPVRRFSVSVSGAVQED